MARNYLIGERPDAILNIIDGTNLERNLYLTTQLTELGIPVVVAINMMDIVKKNGDKINTEELSRQLGCKIVEISALKNTGVMEAAEAAIDAAKNGKTVPMHTFAGVVEHALAHIEEAAVHNMPEEQQRWYAIKIFERDDKVLDKLAIDPQVLAHIEEDIKAAEKEMDDDAESIITNERYIYIASIIKACYKKQNRGQLSTSDKIDKVVTNRWLGLPIFALIMFLVYYISMVTVGAAATDWANDGLFGDGYHLFGRGTAQYEKAAEKYGDSDLIIGAFADAYGSEAITDALDIESENYSEAGAKAALEELDSLVPADASVSYEVEDEETLATETVDGVTKADYEAAAAQYLNTDYKEAYGAPDTSTYGTWVPGIPVLIGNALEAAGTAEWLSGLLLDGIVAGVGAVLGFVPQMLVLFLLLAFLEACGYMARIAFVLDRIFRKFGLSGKSFIPMLIGTGCGIPGIMASRTIENERDRRMTIMTTTFIPCGAKVPFIAMIAGAIFGGSAWIATSAYFVGMAAIIISGIMLKKTKMFAGDPAPFVMELPAYHMPTLGNVLRSMWERGWSFIKKQVPSSYCPPSWYGSPPTSASQTKASECWRRMSWISPSWRPSAAQSAGSSRRSASAPGKRRSPRSPALSRRKTSLVRWASSTARPETFTQLWHPYSRRSAATRSWYSTCCARLASRPSVAIKREMNNAKWTWFAIGYQCGFAYVIALMINQFGNAFTGHVNIIGLIFAIAALALILYMLVRPYKEATKLQTRVKVSM